MVVGTQWVPAVGPDHRAGERQVLVDEPVLDHQRVDEIWHGQQRRQRPDEQNPANCMLVRHAGPQWVDDCIVSLGFQVVRVAQVS